MAEYIEREALMRYPIRRDHYDRKNGNEHFINGIESVLEYAEFLPAADVTPVRHGLWLDNEDYMFCSCCGVQWYYCDNDTQDFMYCPNCGAKMDLEAQHE